MGHANLASPAARGPQNPDTVPRVGGGRNGRVHFHEARGDAPAVARGAVIEQAADGAYRWALYDSIDDTPLDDWNALRTGEQDVFMDPRFVATVERSMSAEARCWTLIVYDGAGQPAATACLSLMQTDAMVVAQGVLQRATTAVRRLWDNFLRFNVLFLGLPVSASQSHFRVRNDADPRQALAAVEAALGELARRHGARAIVLKEFTAEERRLTDGFESFGYLRVEGPPLNCLDVRYKDFDDYCESRSARARHNLRRTIRRLDECEMQIVQLTGDEGADVAYSDAAHCLYEAVWVRAASKVEKLPAEFFRQLARQFGRQAVFTFAYHQKRVVGFGCSLLALPDFHMLFVGIDYAANRQSELYFNLCYKELDFAMRHGASTILAGQTADAFKSRLRCYHRPLCFYVKLRGILCVLRPLTGLLFPPPKPLTPLQQGPAHTNDS